MFKYILIIFLVLISVRAIASQSVLSGFDYTLPAPPKSEDTRSLYSYLYTIYQQWMTAQVTTTSPNGNIDSAYGNVAIYFDGTSYWLIVQTTAPMGTTWVGTKMGTIT